MVEKIKEPLLPTLPLPMEEDFKRQFPKEVTDSTIEKTVVVPPIWEFTPSKPQLDPPSATIWRVIEETLKLESIGELLTEVGHQLVNRTLDKVREIDSDEAEKMKQAIQREKDAGWWEFLKDVGQLFLSALTTVFGFFLLSSGGGAVVGGAMIASGVLTIVNYAMQKAEVWDLLANKLAADNESMREMIKTYIPAAIGIVAAVLGLTGGAATFFFTDLDAAGKALTILETATSLANSTTTLASGISKGRLQWAQSALTLVKGQKELINMRLMQTFTDIETLAKNQAEQASLIQSIVRSNIQAYQLTQLSI
ncbi:MAG: hypothetical protein K940chlam2_01197 [Chlamydiae bacterium]|nr:hypothetical protein [Chlamydiota bacterium]